MSDQDDTGVEIQPQDSEGVEPNGENSDVQSVISCDASLDISMVKVFSEDLKKLVAEGGDVVLDGEKIENVDGAALQLLYAFFHEAQANGQALNWKSPSAALKRSAGLLGMKEHLLLDDY